MAARTNEYRDPHKLKNHPLNIKLYGGAPPTQMFIENIKKFGVCEPLLITVEDVVIAGHTRKNAARIAGLKEVPVIVLRDLADPLDLEELLIASNGQREKTNEMKAREAARLAEIEEVRAAERQKAALKKGSAPVVSRVPQRENHEKGGDSGRTREKVADVLHVSDKTAARLIVSGRELEKAEAEGDTEHAEEIKAGLQKSVSAGHRAAVASEVQSTPFDEPLAAVDWVLKVAVPKVQEHAILAEKALGSGKAGFSADRVSKLVKPIHEAFEGIRGVIAHAQKKARSQ